MKDNNSYIGSLINGITSLLTGMKTTMTVFCRKKTTEQYPENRKTLKLSERFRGTLTMPHNERNEPVPDGLSQRHHQGDERNRRNGRRQEKEDTGEIRIRPRLLYILPALRQCLSARCHHIRPEL